MPQALRILDAKAAVDTEWEELEKLPACHMTIVKSKKDVFLEAQKERMTVHVAALIDICHLKNAELEPKFQKDKVRVALRRFWLSCSVHRTRFVCISDDGRKSNGCHFKATRLRRTSRRRSISSHPSRNGVIPLFQTVTRQSMSHLPPGRVDATDFLPETLRHLTPFAKFCLARAGRSSPTTPRRAQIAPL